MAKVEEFGKIDLSYKFTGGEILEYDNVNEIIQDVTSKGAISRHDENRWTSRTTIKVLRVENDGSAHLVITNEPVTEIEGEAVMNLPPGRDVAYVFLTSRGKILETAGFNPQFIFNLPEEKVTTGDTWKGEQKLYFPFFPNPLYYEVEFIVDGLEQVDKDKLLRVNFRVPETRFNIPLPWSETETIQLLKMQGYFIYSIGKSAVTKAEFLTNSTLKAADTVFDSTIRFLQKLSDGADKKGE
ncbi:MAG: hypothetical protein J7M18_04830 [Candidatus Eremiobacteraeota bacterium]|nr:hypothetical protein [Candidatus Eremiobacteraeota bacterium]